MHNDLSDMESFWEDFLPFVEERRIIPIIGPDLLLVDVDGATKPLYRLVAERLAERLRIDLNDQPNFSLNDVVSAHLQARGRREDLYAKLRSVMKDIQVAPPEPLRQLARIRDFNLFVSLSFDSLLQDALNVERFGGAEQVLQLSYAPNKVTDLPPGRSVTSAPIVYSLFGKLSVAPDYVITEEDMLEFLCALQSEAKRPHLLFDELQNSHLLFLGCTLSDWLARFFIRITKSRQLSQQRSESELLVDPQLGAEPQLVLFLENFSYGTRVMPMDPRHFINELEQRWSARNPARANPGANLGATALARLDETESDLPDLPSGGIFISYAKEDLEAVQRIFEVLSALGLEIWFDKDRLEAGDQYDQKIKRNIKACSLFLPIISQATQRRLEGYFRREWKLAEERSWSMADSVPFILPIVIDDTLPYDSQVPEAFQKVQWTHLPQGAPKPEFETQLVKLVREYRKREKGLV